MHDALEEGMHLHNIVIYNSPANICRQKHPEHMMGPTRVCAVLYTVCCEALSSGTSLKPTSLNIPQHPLMIMHGNITPTQDRFNVFLGALSQPKRDLRPPFNPVLPMQTTHMYIFVGTRTRDCDCDCDRDWYAFSILVSCVFLLLKILRDFNYNVVALFGHCI